MKMQCGNQFTSNLVGMLNDLSVTKDTQTAFDSYYSTLSSSSSSSLSSSLSSFPEGGVVNSWVGLAPEKKIAFTVKVLTTGFWPKQRTRRAIFPPEMLQMQVILI